LTGGDQIEIATDEPRETGMTGWGYSLANLGELLFGCLDAIQARSVLEIGAYKGELTGQLLDWAATSGASVTALDPEPPPELLELAGERPELELVQRTSHDALREIELPDAIVIDGDHNYFTLSEELRLIAERVGDGTLPLLMFHDVSWPHARRDSYYVPDRIPDEHRQPLVQDAHVVPWASGVTDAGLPFAWAAEREGGAANGTLTALEDFVGAHEGVRLATVPAFFGFGALWHEDAPWADAVASIVEPWDRNPLLYRLQQAHELSAERSERIRDLEGRIDTLRTTLGDQHREMAGQINDLTERVRGLAGRVNRQERVLRTMLESRAFSLVERLSRMRRRGEPAVSRERIRRALSEGEGVTADD
jgi:Methyltransferase domain